jgi:hypothetical protein
LEEHLQGLRIRLRQRKMAVVVYVIDIIVLATTPEDIEVLG